MTIRFVKIIFFLIFLFFIFLYFSKVSLTYLNSGKIKFPGFNFQGIECIDDKVFLISYFDNKIYKLNEDKYLELFLDTNIEYKKKHIFSHVTSFYINENKFVGVNSMDKINGIYLVSDLYSKILKNNNYKFFRLKSNLNHLEYFKLINEYEILHKENDKNNTSIIEIHENGEKLCSINNKLSIQNIYFNHFDKTINFISNLAKHRIGVIYTFSLKDFCNLSLINYKNSEKIYIMTLPFQELEGYTICNNKSYFVYINNKNSTIYVN